MAEKSVNWQSYLQIASISDVGMRRNSNQDSLAVDNASSMERWKARGHLYMVADGMGAHAAGELASKIACEKIPQLYTKYSDISPPEALKKSVVETNAIINRKGQANEEFFNMGTTCSVLTLLPQGAVVAHIGDSRVYRLRGNRLEQLTFDHSLVWEMRASGQLSREEEESNLVPKNVITRSLGPYPDVKVDLEGPFPIELNDTFLICSDGLTGLVNDEELGSLLGNLEPHEVVQVLTDLTNLRGGPDNITIVVVKVVHPDLTTARTATKPITIGAKKSKKHMLPMSLACLIAAVVAALLFGFLAGPFSALIPGGIALICLIWVVANVGGFGLGGTVVGAGQRFGRGPYVRMDCMSGEKLVSKLKSITADLREVLINSQIDTASADRVLVEAAKATEAQNHPVAIKFFARSISMMMDEVRRRGQQGPSDSSVDL